MSKSIFTINAAIASILMLFGPIDSHAQDNPVFVGSGVEFMPQFYSDEIVKNAPVTARITTRSVQQLLDGNRIVHEDVTNLLRDSRGRVRRESSSGNASSHSMISLSDPVQKHTFMLDPTNKIAFELPEIGDLIGMESAPFGAASIAGPEVVGDMSGSAVEIFFDSDIAAGGDGAYTDQVMIAEGMGSVQTSSGSLIAIPQGAEVVVANGIEIGDSGMRSASGSVWPSAGQTAVQPLGQKTMGGVRLEGTSYTTTYPANTFGNELAIVVEKTTWFAPELRMMVRTETQDPRFGTVTYEADILSTDEPDASLFEIPSDYKIIDSDKGEAPPPED